MDRILTGILVLIVVTVGSMFVMGVTLVETVVGQDTTIRMFTYVQGYLVHALGDRPMVPVPVIQMDGTLSPMYKGDLNGETLVVPVLFPSQMMTWAYEHSRGFKAVYLPPEARERWVLDSRKGIMHYDANGAFDGSLGDDGFVAGREVRSSFNEAVRIFAPQRDITSFSIDPVFAYLTDDGLFRVDLVERKLTRIATFEGVKPFFEFRPWGEGNIIHAFSKDRIYWIESKPGGEFGSFNIPEMIRSVESFEFGKGSEDRLILRVQEGGSRAEGFVRYRVAVVGARGELLNQYTYRVEAGPGIELVDSDTFTTYRGEGRLAAKLVRESSYGWLFQVLISPAWRLRIPVSWFAADGCGPAG
jgi:hypothetical protein